MGLYHQPHGDDGPGPVLVDHNPRGDYVVTGVYGLVDLDPIAADTDPDRGGRTHVLFLWAQAAPYVIRGIFTDPTNGRHISWELSRQILRDGSDDPDGDVRLTWNDDTVHLTLSSPTGHASVTFDAVWFGALLTATYDLVPAADEWNGAELGLDFPFAVLDGDPDRSGHRRPGTGGAATAPDPDNLPTSERHDDHEQGSN